MKPARFKVVITEFTRSSHVKGLTYERTIPLWHSGSCNLIGVGAAPYDLYAEEVYGEGSWIAQIALRRDGTLIAIADEAHGENPNVSPLPLPGSLKRPGTGWISMALNVGGAPPRGLMAEERIYETARPLKTSEKQALIAAGYLPDVPPVDILGIIGSYVKSEAEVVRGLAVLVRQLRVAVRTGDEQIAEDSMPYDYISYEFSIVQTYRRAEPDQGLQHTMLDESHLGVSLACPTDLIYRDNLLVIADAGAGVEGRVSALHLWQFEPEPPPSEEDQFYGSLDNR
jgi:hypothetical protein